MNSNCKSYSNGNNNSHSHSKSKSKNITASESESSPGCIVKIFLAPLIAFILILLIAALPMCKCKTLALKTSIRVSNEYSGQSVKEEPPSEPPSEPATPTNPTNPTNPTTPGGPQNPAPPTSPSDPSAPQIPPTVDIYPPNGPPILVGPFDPQETPKTGDNSNLNMLFGALGVGTFMLRHIIIKGRRR